MGRLETPCNQKENHRQLHRAVWETLEHKGQVQAELIAHDALDAGERVMEVPRQHHVPTGPTELQKE